MTQESSRREYTAEEMVQKLQGYIPVPPALWDHIPRSCHIRYLEQGPGPAHMRFRAGGWMQEQCIRDNVRGFTMSTAYRGGAGAAVYFAAYSNVEAIWKRITPQAVIEFLLINKTIEDMRIEIKRLGAELEKLRR